MEKIIKRINELKDDKKSIKSLVNCFIKNQKAIELFGKDKIFNDLKNK